MDYMCINTKCENFDLTCFEGCDSYGIRYDGHKCNKAIVICENDAVWDSWEERQEKARLFLESE